MSAEFADYMLAWFDQHGRKHLPWQQTTDPYPIWVSEIMLQQTQVTTVLPYYRTFMQRFPDVLALADAKQDDVLAHWSGLGYYARGRNLHKAAQQIRGEHQGQFPQSLEAMQALPGVGRSTAGAVLAAAFGQRQAILDGNVKRVLARHGAVSGWPGSTVTAKRLWALAEQYTPQQRVRDYNQAMMDLGALVCKRNKPQCLLCPVQDSCLAKQQGLQQQLPESKPKKDKPVKQGYLWMLRRADGSVLLERRPPAGIWGGLWCFPQTEQASELPETLTRLIPGVTSSAQAWAGFRHTFSHYHLDIQPMLWAFEPATGNVIMDDAALLWYKPGDPAPGGLAAPTQQLLETLAHGTHG